MMGCEAAARIGPLIREGSDFSFDFDFEWETGVACPMYVLIENATVVLGALAPGDYTLTTTSWGVPVATTPFTVPTNSTPTLQPICVAADGSVSNAVERRRQRALRPAMLDEFGELDLAFDQFNWAAVDGPLSRLARLPLLSGANSPDSESRSWLILSGE